MAINNGGERFNNMKKGDCKRGELDMAMKQGRYITALTIAGSDCSGGAGIQADIKTMSALGVYAASVVTAVTVQNTLGVVAVESVGADAVEGQIHAVMSDIEPRAVKIGMVNDRRTIAAVAAALAEYSIRHLVIDPVMISTSGMRLMKEDALDAFCCLLMPRATLLTPNLPEAEVLSGMRIRNSDDALAAGRVIAKQTRGAVLIKGGHADDGCRKCDRLYDRGGMLLEVDCPTVETLNTHGTGCTLSAAITSFLALGFTVEESLRRAKMYMTEALRQGSDVRIGRGHGPVNHFFSPQRLVKEDWQT